MFTPSLGSTFCLDGSISATKEGKQVALRKYPFSFHESISPKAER